MRVPHIVISLLISSIWFNSAAFAGEVVMTTGERFSTSKVWEENGKIRFNMHGLVVSVNKSDVAVISGTGRSSQTAVKADPPPSTPLLPDPIQPTKPQAKASPPPRMQPPAPSPVETSKPASKVQGIGFNGISWNMRPADLPGLTKIGTEEAYGGIDQYSRPDGSMTLADVLLDGLVFGFWQNRLYSIMIWVDGKSAFDGLQRVVLNRYGDGTKSKTVTSRWVWLDDKTTDRMLEYDEERNVGIFWMRSRELDRHIKTMYK